MTVVDKEQSLVAALGYPQKHYGTEAVTKINGQSIFGFQDGITISDENRIETAGVRIRLAGGRRRHRDGRGARRKPIRPNLLYERRSQCLHVRIRFDVYVGLPVDA